MTEFVHLHVHSEYSVSDGLLTMKSINQLAQERELAALAITDKSNLFAFVKFYENAIAQGVKPLAGVELLVESKISGASVEGRVVLLAMNKSGYSRLMKLVSSAYTDSCRRGVVAENELLSDCDDLIVLSGGVRGHLWDLFVKGDTKAVKEVIQKWKGVLQDRYFLEITRTGRSNEDAFVTMLLRLSQECSVGVVATNDVCFEEKNDYEAHEARVCINDGRTLDDPRREKSYSEEQYLKTPAEMKHLFEDVPQAISNSVEIAKRCNLMITLDEYYLPHYPTPDNTGLDEFLSVVARKGLDKIIDALDAEGPYERRDYDERLDYELQVINQMGFPGYFLIVMEFIDWAKKNDIPVGPGRGSGSGSLVAYSLGITDIDPLEYGLLFERFLNPERVSMPDFDVDFCMEGRDRVIKHVSDLYGAESVSQIITFGTMSAKAVVRDVARVQGKPYGLADRLSKLIPFEVGMTLKKAMKESKELKEFVNSNDEVEEIMDMAYRLEGLTRNVGRHAGGVVISPGELTEFVPLYTEESSGAVLSQFDKDDVERAGLVKFDFLGLKTLTIIDWTIKAINKERADEGVPHLDISQINLDDEKTFELLKSTKTTGIFQLESRGMRDLIARLGPESLNDIIALVALFRPGPLQSGAADDFVNRKHGLAPIEYPHPDLKPVLKETFGVVLYQEQVMQIAQELAGFSLGQADLLRRAMGKKKPEEMAKVREQFIEGAKVKEISDKLAEEIFDLMEKFAGYAFNKSHSATYALISYQTAWLKAHYPAQFLAANLSAEMQNIDRVVILADEVNRLGLTLKSPNVNQSSYAFKVAQGDLIYGLGALRGVGETAVDSIQCERESGGAYNSLVDFCHRVESKKVNKRVVEALIMAGAMDCFSEIGSDLNKNRGALLSGVSQAIQGAEQNSRDKEAGIVDLFGDVASTNNHQIESVDKPISNQERLSGEKEVLGLFLTGHPIDEYESELKNFCAGRIVDLKVGKKNQVLAGTIFSIRTTKGRNGSKMCFLVLDDKSSRIEVSVFSDRYEKYSKLLFKDRLIVVEGELSNNDYGEGLSVRAEKILDINEARIRYAHSLCLDFSGALLPDDFSHMLKNILSPHLQTNSGSRVSIKYSHHNEAEALLSLGENWMVTPSDDLLSALKEEFGENRVIIEYA